MNTDPEIENMPPRLSILGAALWTLAVIFVLAFVVGISESMRPGAKSDLVTLTGASFVGYLLVFFAMLRVYQPETDVRAALGLRTFEGRSVPLRSIFGIALALMLGFELFLIANPVEAFLTKLIPQATPAEDLIGPLLDTTTLARRVVLVVSTGVVLPVLQELFFRGMIFGRLEEAGGATHAMVVTATLSTAFHAQMDVRLFPILLVVNFVLSLLRYWTGGVVLPAVVTALYMGPTSYLVATGRGELVLSWRYAEYAALLALVSIYLLLRLSLRAVQDRLLDLDGAT